MSVPGTGYVVHNKARVALERAFRNPRKRVLGVDRESKWTFGFFPHGMGVADIDSVYPVVAHPLSLEEEMTADQKSALAGVVTIDKEIMHGTPCFAQTRVPVQTLIDFLETGETIDDFLAVYPTIPRQHVFSFLELSRDIAIDQLACASL
jgi:uncharacterized protein (DUF433 family)